MSLMIVSMQKMHVIGRHRLDAKFASKFQQLTVALHLRLQSVIMELKIIILAKYLPIPPNRLPCFLQLVLLNQFIDLPRQTARETNQALAKQMQILTVRARLVILTIQMRPRNQFHQVRIPRLVRRQQREMTGILAPRHLLAQRLSRRSHIHLTPNNWLHPRLPSRQIKFHRPK